MPKACSITPIDLLLNSHYRAPDRECHRDGACVSNHKRLRGGVVFLPATSKSLSGKILRKDLPALAKKQADESKL
ncbi:hypothetical protein C8A00DRAFT_37384 [Chaetomidium leptoderma]|uniref:Uncharacterized protein n=1 Tax=Chaetomidium leptoderma TaxID=669021 RepID=A0AAN6VEU3_9PEZI|nr:hypothetical protein C8A00DRAFT_37384 [Chaetomidium leptoderma]